MIKNLVLGLLGAFFNKGDEQEELPLDGTARTRLVNMRVRKDRRTVELSPSRRNFLTKLHSSGSPLSTQRTSTSRVKVQWLLNEQALFDSSLARSQETIAKFYETMRVCPDTGSGLDSILNSQS